MHGAAVVNGAPSRGQGEGDGIGRIESLEALDRVDAGVVARRAVRQNSPLCVPGMNIMQPLISFTGCSGIQMLISVHWKRESIEGLVLSNLIFMYVYFVQLVSAIGWPFDRARAPRLTIVTVGFSYSAARICWSATERPIRMPFRWPICSMATN